MVSLKRMMTLKKRPRTNSQVWTKEINITVLPQRKDYLGLKYFYMDYAGGAHPNSAIIYKNYNATTLKEITLDDISATGKPAHAAGNC